MKFSAHLSEIIKQLKEVARLASSGSKKEDDITLNVLMKVQNRVLTIKSTDYNIELEASIPLADAEEDGIIAVNASKLVDVCSRNSNTDNVQFYDDETKGVLVINADNTIYEVRTRSASEFPTFAVEDEVQNLTLTQKQLKKLIDLSIFCVSNEDFREYLRGVRFEAEGNTLSVFSSDGHRMAILDTQIPTTVAQPLGALLTKQGTEQISSIIDGSSDSQVELKFTKNSVSVNCNGYSLKSKLITVPYPNVRNVIPTRLSNEVLLPRKRFAELINRVSVLSSKRVNGVLFSFSEGKCDLKSENREHEVATHSENVPFTGAPIEIALNYMYINDCLSHLSSENVNIKFADPLTSVVISPVFDSEPAPDEVLPQYVISKIVL